MGQGQGAFTVVYHNGLGVVSVCGAGGAIAHMAYCHVPLAQPGQGFWGKYLLHQADVLVGGNDAVVAHGNAAALLPPVLQSKETIVGSGCHLPVVLGVNAKDAAFLSQFLHELGILLCVGT